VCHAFFARGVGMCGVAPRVFGPFAHLSLTTVRMLSSRN
jgi:hypothetical protein